MRGRGRGFGNGRDQRRGEPGEMRKMLKKNKDHSVWFFFLIQKIWITIER